MRTNRSLLLLNFACIYLIWGSTYLVIKTALEGFPPYLLISLRLSAASIILILISRLKSDELPSFRQFKNSMLLGFIFFILCNATIVWSQQFMNSGLVAILLCSQPLFIAILQHTLTRKRIPLLLLTGILTGSAGVLLLQKLDTTNTISGIYLALILLASLSGATGAVLSYRLDIPKSPWMNGSIQMGFAATFCGIVSLINGDFYRFQPENVSKESWYSFAYLVIFGSIVAYTAYNYLVTRVSPNAVATHSFVNPLVALLLSVAISGEMFGWEIAIPSTLLLAAVLLMLASEKFKKNSSL